MSDKRKTDIWFGVAISLMLMLLGWIKSDTQELKGQFSKHAGDQVVCEKKVDSKLACLEQIVYGKAYATNKGD